MSKFIKDSIYNYIEFSEDDMKLIDTREFKRLKSIKQLGSLNEVFPSACHSRFEHSLGVGYLSEKFINKLFQNSDIRIDESKKKLLEMLKSLDFFTILVMVHFHIVLIIMYYINYVLEIYLKITK